MSVFCPSYLEETIPFLVYSINGLSVFGSIMVLTEYILIHKIRENWLMRNLAYLNISNLFFGASAIFVYYDIFMNQTIPQNQLFNVIFAVHTISRYSSFIWPLILAINLYQIIVAKRSNNLSRYECFWLLIGFVIPILIISILKCFGQIQFEQSLAPTLINFIIPVVLIIFFTLLAYIKFIKAAQVAFGNEEAKKIMKIILPYSFATIIILIPVCAFNILYSNDGCFTLLSSILLLIRFLQGAIDAIIFSFNPSIREEIRKYFRKSNETIIYEFNPLIM